MGGIDFAVYMTPEMVYNCTRNDSMPRETIHRASTRGHANHGWLDSYHTFSYAEYYDPQRIHFGKMRILNDDTVAPGMGFATHPHRNMEIVSIPLEGALEHRDSMGNVSVIRKGDVQVISSGSGVMHSEYNHNRDRMVKFLQVWIFPEKENQEPRYGHARIDLRQMDNNLATIVSPHGKDGGASIHQNSWFHMGRLDKGREMVYKLHGKHNGIYTFVIKGQVRINGNDLHSRDGIGLWDLGTMSVEAITNSEVLIIEVPMH